MAERIVSPQVLEQDVSLDSALRPRSLDEFINQERVVKPLRIFIQAARERGEALDHVLLYGPPGLGKSTLCQCIAHDCGVNIRITSGPAVERPGDLAAILTNLRPKDILFIDEIHRLSPVVEEYLYPAMESYKLDIIMGKGPSARSIRLPLPPFTLIGATTRIAMMTAPLRSRFGVVYRLDFFHLEAMIEVANRSAVILQLELTEEGVLEVARRARGTPRVANRLLKRVRDYAQVHQAPIVTAEVAEEALALLEVDPLGLDEIDRRLMSTIATKFAGGPVGLETIAAAIGEEADTIMDVYEPYLLQLGFLERTQRGRVLTPHAYEHLGLPYEASANQKTLF